MSLIEQTHPKEVLPKDWAATLNETADVERALRQLIGTVHWYAESLKGCLKSRQNKPHEAERHFQAADEKSMRPEKLEESVLHAMHLAHWQEHRIANGTVDKPMGADIIANPQPGKWGVVQRYWGALNATLKLFRGDYTDALYDYDRLAAWPDSGKPRYDAKSRIAGGVCCHNLGDNAGAEERLELAGITLRLSGSRWAQTNNAASLHFTYREIGHDRHASDWLSYLQALPVPRRTVDDALARHERLGKMSRQLSRLVIV